MTSPVGRLDWTHPDWRQHVNRRLDRLEERIEEMEASESQLATDLQAISSGIDDVSGEVAALQQQITQLQANQPVSQDQLNSLVQSADAAVAKLNAIPKPTPPAPPAPGPTPGP